MADSLNRCLKLGSNPRQVAERKGTLVESGICASFNNVICVSGSISVLFCHQLVQWLVRREKTGSANELR